jgi:DNA-binding response OmpR family regulator
MSFNESLHLTATVLMVDDDTRLARMVKTYLADASMVVTLAASVKAARDAFQHAGPFDLAIFDVMLPDGDGFEFLREIRARGDTLPVLMLTARGDPIDRIVGLELGADDYLSKPFEPRELLARLRANLRRSRLSVNPNTDYTAASTLKFRHLEINCDARTVSKNGVPCLMTGHQFSLLMVLALNAGRVLTRDQLMERVKGENIEAFDRSIDVHISRIRSAIEDNPKEPQFVITLRGVGYLFARS